LTAGRPRQNLIPGDAALGGPMGELGPQATAAWLDLACEATGGRDASCSAETSDGRPVTVPLVRLRRRGRAVDWSLPYGFGAPGLLVEGPVSAGDLAPVVARLRDRGAAEVRIRTTPADAAAWIATPGARHVPHRVHVLDLDAGWDSVWAGFRKEARKTTRKARGAGTSVHRVDDPVTATETYLEVWREWVRDRASRSPVPTPLLELAAARRDPPRHFRLAAQRLGGLYEVWVADHGGRAIAAQLVLLHGREAVAWRTASTPDARPARANDLMMATVVESLCDRGVQRYVLGESGGKQSLEAFKEKFGGRAHDVPEMVIRT
jgi:Acetyltransferase (GNAT) domain